MKRKAIDKLIEWNNSNNGKPVLLTGAKGVGKTYLAYDFAKAFFDHIVYINFEREPGAHKLFQGPPQKIKEQLLEIYHIPDNSLPQNRILILDEITFCAAAVEQLLQLYMHDTFPKIIIITSIPLPVKEQEPFLSIPIHPLEFDEFLLATAKDWYIEAILTHFEANKPLPDIVHKELLALHEQYLMIGGMPRIINEYLNFSSPLNVPEQHSLQLGAYHDYILKSCTDSDALKMNQVLDSLSIQLMKDNKKFQYNLIRKGTTHAMYKDAIRQLKNRGYILQSIKYPSDRLNNINIQNYTSTAYTNVDETSDPSDVNISIKLYFPDVGFLYSKIAEENRNPSEAPIRKALLENYVAQAFHSKGYPLMFWESDSMAKVDFLMPKEQQLIPVEVHNSDNTRSKSISILKQKYDFPYAIKISSKNYDYTNGIKYVPYYAVFCL